jgi:fluoride exporter
VTLRTLFLVCAAGAIGSGVRFFVVTSTQRAFGESFPWGVFGVNLAGSFLIAVLSIVAISKAEIVTPEVRAALGVGFLGGLTTYSSFNQDTLAMLDRRQYATAALYVGTTLVLCLGAGLAGTALARRL